LVGRAHQAVSTNLKLSAAKRGRSQGHVARFLNSRTPYVYGIGRNRRVTFGTMTENVKYNG